MEKFKSQAKSVHDFMGVLSKEHPKVGAGFVKVHQAALEENVLSGKQKELIALGISIAVRCEGCIACHVQSSLEQGATQEEIIETIGVAILMGGGPSVTYGEKAFAAMKEMM